MSAAHLAVRPADNPFASHRVESLAFRGNGVVMSDLVQRTGDLGRRAAIVGPEGSGKTTLLEELARRLPGEPVMVSLPGSCRHPWRTASAQLSETFGPHHVVVLDGGEQLGPLAWRRFLAATRRAGCLVATLHRPGRLPTLVECRTDPSLLQELVTELAPASGPRANLDDLFDRHRGNIRLCFRELYDLHAGRAPATLANRDLTTRGR
jgi:hypothetical protein